MERIKAITERRITMNGKKLYKIKNGAMITGVCNGVAAYFDVDVSLVRLATVVATFFTGVGVVAYLAAAVILPEVDNSPYPSNSGMNNANNVNGGFNANTQYNAAPEQQNTDQNDKDII